MADAISPELPQGFSPLERWRDARKRLLHLHYPSYEIHPHVSIGVPTLVYRGPVAVGQYGVRLPQVGPVGVYGFVEILNSIGQTILVAANNLCIEIALFSPEELAELDLTVTATLRGTNLEPWWTEHRAAKAAGRAPTPVWPVLRCTGCSVVGPEVISHPSVGSRDDGVIFKASTLCARCRRETR